MLCTSSSTPISFPPVAAHPDPLHTIIVSLLARIIHTNDVYVGTTPQVRCSDICGWYVSRLVAHAPVPQVIWVLMLVMLDRVATPITSNNATRVLVVAFMVASKMYSDNAYSNMYIAKVTGIPLHELNDLEFKFLFQAKFTLTVSLDEFTHYADRLAGYAAFMKLPSPVRNAVFLPPTNS